MSTPSSTDLPVAVIGAGPVGLAAAAHLIGRGLTPLIFESGPTAGAAVDSWAHIRLFSSWEYNIDAASRVLLESTGWQAPRPTALPYGRELVSDYLRSLSEIPAITEALHTNTRVVAVSRWGMDKTRTKGRNEQPFLVRTESSSGIQDHRVRAVIDASGTWQQPNPLGQAGLPASGEAAASAFITRPLPDVTGTDRARFEGKRVLVVGAGHSAANTLISLGQVAKATPDTEVIWAVRGTGSAERLYGGGDLDGLPARGALGSKLRSLVRNGIVELRTSFTITGFTPGKALTVTAETPNGTTELEVDVLIPATGFRPNLDMLRELRLELDPAVEAPRALGPLIDPEFHSCGTVAAHGADVLAHPEKDFYLVGMKSYGRAPTFLLATGYEQVRSVAAAIAGDHADAARVALELPETGVCSTDLGGSCDAPALTVPVPSTAEAVAAACCSPSPSDTDADVEVPAPSAQESTGGCCAGPQLVSIGIPTGTAHGRSADPDY